MLTLTIPQGTNRTDAILLERDLLGIGAPDAWTAAPVSFRVSVDGVSYSDLTDKDGNVVLVSMEPSGTFMDIPAQKAIPFPGGTHLIIVSGSPQEPVVQQGDRTFSIYLVAEPAPPPPEEEEEEPVQHSRSHKREPEHPRRR